MMNNIPYFSIEGIKGSGKSTVRAEVCNRIKARGLRIQNLNTTSPMPATSIPERLHQWMPGLRKKDWFNEWLYAKRACWQSKQLMSEADLILGDRSIATSYVTRLYKWNVPQKCIERVDIMEDSVPVPDHIIWLYCEPELAMARIPTRPSRNYGLLDEQYDRLVLHHRAYDELFHNGIAPRLAQAKLVEISGVQRPEEIADQITIYILNQLKQEKNISYG